MLVDDPLLIAGEACGVPVDTANAIDKGVDSGPELLVAWGNSWRRYFSTICAEGN